MSAESGQCETIEVEVLDYIEENEPVEQDDVEAEFGRRGLSALVELMIRNKVSYDLEFNLVCE